MAHEYRRVRRVEFAETDTAGIVHFSNYLRYMEETEHEFLRSLGLTVHPVRDATDVGFPRLSARCEFQRPLRFEDEVEITLRVARKGRSSLTYHFLLESSGAPVARGEIVVVCCRFTPGGTFESAPLPDAYDQAIDEAPGGRMRFGRSERSDHPV